MGINGMSHNSKPCREATLTRPGLLPLLKSIHKPCNLKKFEGKTIGVDAYGWLHRGTVACAIELATGKPTKKYILTDPIPRSRILTFSRFVDYAMHRVRMLQHFGVTPFLIFDGDYLPSKAATEAEREKRRGESRKAGLELLNAGKTSQAHVELQKAVDVTPAMARQLIDELRRTGVQYIVAPYEADAQMVYLERKGIIDGILSEDSDLLVFGAKCLLTKLDQYGNCIEINKADFCACKEVSLTGWTDTEFRCMAILSGCDYLASINNMGLKTAYRMVRRHKTIEKVLRMLSFDGKYRVPKGYLEDFYRAELTFLHQRVFCPKSLRIVFHTEPTTPIAEEQMPFIGSYVEPEIAQGIARGDLDPMTKKPIVTERRDNMASPATPWTVSKAQPQRLPPGDSKKGKPIDTFFKSKRIPLAELDINCFTPSPIQQVALHRNPGTWLTTPAPRQYLNQANGNAQQIHQSIPAPVPITRRAHIHTRTTSEPRPSKRARLCEEADIDSMFPGQATELGRSRYFNQADAVESLSISKKPQGRRSKKEDITIFSDDSIEEALLSLPDFNGFSSDATKPSGVSVLEENARNTVGLEKEQVLVPASTTTDVFAGSYIKTPALTPSVSTTSSEEEQNPTPGEAAALTTTANRRLLKEFSSALAQTPARKPNIGIYGQPTPSSSVATKPSRIPLAVKSNASAPIRPTLSGRFNWTPLQRLATSATNRSNFPMTPPLTPMVVPKTHLLRRSVLSKGDVPFPEVAKDKIAVNPSAVPLPLADEAENLALSMQGGSEDMIVHDSESEGDDAGVGADGLTPGIGLERFAYTTA
jgi:exonuclease-1